MSRYKRVIGSTLRSQGGPAQEVETQIAAKALNRMLGARTPSAPREKAKKQGHSSPSRLRAPKWRTQHINRIKGLLMTQGIRTFMPASRDWRERLAKLRTGDGRDIPRALKAEIERECERLQLVMDMIRKVEAERDAAHDNAGQVGMLTRLGGITAISAHVLALS